MRTVRRMLRLLSAHINSLLERAGDPEHRAHQAARERQHHAAEARIETARAITAERLLTRETDYLRRRRGDWQRRAEAAVARGEDALARAALGRKYDCEDRITELEQRLSHATAVAARLRNEHRALVWRVPLAD